MGGLCVHIIAGVLSFIPELREVIWGMYSACFDPVGMLLAETPMLYSLFAMSHSFMTLERRGFAKKSRSSVRSDQRSPSSSVISSVAWLTWQKTSGKTCQRLAAFGRRSWRRQVRGLIVTPQCQTVWLSAVLPWVVLVLHLMPSNRWVLCSYQTAGLQYTYLLFGASRIVGLFCNACAILVHSCSDISNYSNVQVVSMVWLRSSRPASWNDRHISLPSFACQPSPVFTGQCLVNLQDILDKFSIRLGTVDDLTA